MSSLIILCVLGFGFFILRRWWVERREQLLRENPPQRAGIEVALPHGSDNSPRSFAQFLRKVASAATADEKTRRTGKRQIDILYLATVPAEGAEPQISFRIYADPDRIDAVKRAIKQVYKACEVNPVPEEEDELLALAEHYKPQPDAEPEEMDAQPPAPEDQSAMPAGVAG